MILFVFWLVLAGFAVVAFVMSFFVKRHGEARGTEPGWVRTDEVFVDPTTTRRMRVWEDPADGTRHYVPEGTSR